MVEQILQTDPVWAAYALADLQPQFASDCRWFPVRNEGLVLLFDGLTPTVIFAMGSTAIVEEALASAPLPARAYIHVRENHLPLLQRHYEFGGDVRSMLRLRMVDAGIATQDGRLYARRLQREDTPRIRSLYANGGEFAPEFFSDYQIESGLFFGIDVDDELIAVGGTHILDLTRSVAAVGNMYTHPAHRGQGHATSILAALVQKFMQHDLQTVVMNVDERNTVARNLYESLGFEVYCSYFEGVGELRAVLS